MKRNLVYAALALPALFAMSCSSDNPQIPREDIVLPTSSRAGINDFTRVSFDLFNAAREEAGQKNLIFSPLSANITLAMMANGAKGETRREITDFLIQDSSIEEVNALCAQLIPALKKVDPQCSVLIANSLWYESETPANMEYVKIIQDNYGANSSGIDFNDKDGARNIINSWIENSTNGNLSNVVRSVDDYTKFMFANTLYFKGQWTEEFEKTGYEYPFYTEDGNELQVAGMHGLEPVKYSNLDMCTVVCLPYGNEAFEMVMFVPEKGKTFQEMSEWLTAEEYTRVMSAYKDFNSSYVDLGMPKFSISQQNYNLIPWLLKNGIITAFNIMEADFTGIFDRKQCFQSATLDVDEKGTTAVADSDSEVGGLTAVTHNQFCVNRPFIYMIREQSTGAILFMGQVIDPTQN